MWCGAVMASRNAKDADKKQMDEYVRTRPRPSNPPRDESMTAHTPLSLYIRPRHDLTPALVPPPPNLSMVMLDRLLELSHGTDLKKKRTSISIQPAFIQLAGFGGEPLKAPEVVSAPSTPAEPEVVSAPSTPDKRRGSVSVKVSNAMRQGSVSVRRGSMMRGLAGVGGSGSFRRTSEFGRSGSVSDDDQNLTSALSKIKKDARRKSSIDARKMSINKLAENFGAPEPERDRLEWHEIMKAIPAFESFTEDQVSTRACVADDPPDPAAPCNSHIPLSLSPPPRPRNAPSLLFSLGFTRTIVLTRTLKPHALSRACTRALSHALSRALSLSRQLNMAFDSLEEIIVRPGEMIIKQGEEGNEIFILEEGTAVVTRKANSKDEREVPKHVCFIESPSYFGETAIITSEKRNATVSATETGLVLMMMRREVYKTICKASNARGRTRTSSSGGSNLGSPVNRGGHSSPFKPDGGADGPDSPQKGAMFEEMSIADTIAEMPIFQNLGRTGEEGSS